MPKKPTRIIGRNVDENLTGLDVEYIEQGFTFAGFDEPDPSRARRLWSMYKKSRKLKEYITRHPGQRPALYWRVECGEPFKVLGHTSRAAPFPNVGKWIVYEVKEIELQALERLGMLAHSEKEMACNDESIGEALQRQKMLLKQHQERLASLPASKFIRAAY